MEFIKIQNLNEYLIDIPVAAFFVRVTGDSMNGAGIYSGDLLIVEKCLTADHNDVIVACLNNEFTVKRMIKHQGNTYLCPANSPFKPIKITEGLDFEVWAIVKYAIHTLGK
jgi:DNA polymerase V